MQPFPTSRAARQSTIKHRQDVLRQIILPMVIVIVLIVAAAVLVAVATANGGDVSKWAAVATIWMIIPLMALMLVILLLSWGVVYLLARLLQVSPHYLGIGQEYALRFNDMILLWVDRIMQPILKIKAWLGMFSREE